MNKENVTRDVGLRVQPSLFDKFSAKCKNNYKTVSEVLRDFMTEYIKEEKRKT